MLICEKALLYMLISKHSKRSARCAYHRARPRTKRLNCLQRARTVHTQRPRAAGSSSLRQDLLDKLDTMHTRAIDLFHSWDEDKSGHLQARVPEGVEGARLHGDEQ